MMNNKLKMMIKISSINYIKINYILIKFKKR